MGGVMKFYQKLLYRAIRSRAGLAARRQKRWRRAAVAKPAIAWALTTSDLGNGGRGEDGTTKVPLGGAGTRLAAARGIALRSCMVLSRSDGSLSDRPWRLLCLDARRLGRTSAAAGGVVLSWLWCLGQGFRRRSVLRPSVRRSGRPTGGAGFRRQGLA